MATGGTVHLDASATPGIHHATTGLTTESAKKASELLQRNHDDNHIFFNASGFHNHIAHHLLALYALGASPQQLQHAFDSNQGYQRKQFPLDAGNVQDLSDPERFKECLGKEKYYHDFEAFFGREIDEKGYEAVVKEYLLKGDERADDLLWRTYAGFYHPLIHLGYGIEFAQPAIIAEALAQAAVHDNWTASFLAPLKALPTPTPSDTPTPLTQLLTRCRADATLAASAHDSDGNKVRDGVLARAPSQMLAIARQWFVARPLTAEGLERATAEMVAACAWFAGAAQRPDLGKMVKFDFFYMHCVNCSVFFSAIVRQGWLSLEEKARLLEMKGRMDLALYVSRGCPELRGGEVSGYEGVGKGEEERSWEGVRRRVAAYDDDGHAAKLVRALGNGESVCRRWEGEVGEEVLPVRGDMWLRLGNMAIDSVEAGGPRWVRNAGFDAAWEEVPEREKARL
ncbi:uncharacterized protein HMPREF1541_08921 [Cyphellophora europaea CBS 101466]|uniref:HypA-like protein n=1 Tax=Cyphellophora europaea (strain CBS 101466) TaxID=1220924 RepID=W2RLQ5_CYPE1|nr:uncharacterized protein HMPREF1541_08921 [Cyphellophora europaea CBS 101466]ETN36643.1 hypothetical protein HMPREF1541_08921 [Cyphellophora europaea CBS 101466]